MKTLNAILSIPNRSILYSQKINNINDAVKMLYEDDNNLDIVTYYVTKEYSIINSNLLEKDSNGNLYYQFNPRFSHYGDMVDNIEINTGGIPCDICFYVNDERYTLNELNPFYNRRSSQYNLNVKLRVTFLEEPSNNTVFTIRSRHYVMTTPINKELVLTDIVTNYVQYSCSNITRFIPNVIE